MILTICLALSPALSAEPNDGGKSELAPDSVLVTYDLRPVLPEFDSGGWQQSLVISPEFDNFIESVSIAPGELYGKEGPDVIVDLLSQVVGEELRQAGAQFSLEGESDLVVLAPPLVQTKVGAALALLEAALSASAEIVVDVYALDSVADADFPAKNVLSSADAERLAATWLGRGATRRTSSVRLTAGRTSLVDQTRRTPFLRDFDVEIAQGAAIQDPILDEAITGLRFALRGVPAAGGIALGVFLFDGELVGGVQEHALKVRAFQGMVQGSPTDSNNPFRTLNLPFDGATTFIEGPTALQSVDVLYRSVAFDTFLPADKTLVLSSMVAFGGKKSGELVFLRLASNALKPFHAADVAETTRRLVLVNSEIVRPLRFDFHSSGVDYAYASQPLIDATLGGESSFLVFDWMKDHFSVWRKMGPWALAVTDPAWDQGSAQDLERMVAQWKADTRLIDVDVVLRSGDAGGVVMRFGVPIRPGGSAGAVIGVTSTLLVDYDVEVAQLCAVADAMVAPMFHGLALALDASQNAAGSISLGLRGRAQLLSGPVGTFDAKSPFHGPISLATLTGLRIEERLSITRTDGKPGRASIGDGSPQGTRLEIEVR